MISTVILITFSLYGTLKEKWRVELVLRFMASKTSRLCGNVENIVKMKILHGMSASCFVWNISFYAVFSCFTE